MRQEHAKKILAIKNWDPNSVSKFLVKHEFI